VVVSVHIADLRPGAVLGVLARPPRPGRVPGLTYAETLTTAPFGEPLLPPKHLGQVAMIAAWEEEGALEDFCRGHSLAERLAGGWQLRCQPLRVSGFWPGMPGLPAEALPVEDAEPVAVLTLGRLRLLRTGAFRRSAAPAEADAAGDRALLAGTGLARLPRLVATFSLWRSAAAMRAYAYRDGGSHEAAIRAHRDRPFHHESAFVRFRPYASQGSWNGRDPLAGIAAATSAGRPQGLQPPPPSPLNL
jgi:hypothetical protein